MTVTLNLTPEEARALRELAEIYLADDGPAYECMPEWEPAHAPDTLASLRKIIMAEIAA